jgi:hypothetical protein
MARRAYILTFDRDDEVDYKEFHNKLTTLPSVITWWHYIKSSYILISNLTNATTLNAEIIQLLPKGKNILLMEVNMKNRNGLLVKDAWDWLAKETTRII